MSLIDLNDPKNAPSRGDVPEAVRWLVEVPYVAGEKEPEYASFGDHWIDQRTFLGDGPFFTPPTETAVDEAKDMDMTFARPATAAEIAAHCPEIPDGSADVVMGAENLKLVSGLLSEVSDSEVTIAELRQRIAELEQDAVDDGETLDRLRGERDDALEAVKELEDLLSSARSICQRKGELTAWQRFDERIAKLGISAVTPRPFRVLPSDLEMGGSNNGN